MAKFKPTLLYYLTIPFVAFLLWAMYYLGQGGEHTEYETVVWSVFNTTGLWLGCYVTVTWLWKRFPWERSPIKHLVLEVALIAAYTNLFICFLWVIYPFVSHEQYPESVFEAFMHTNLITFLITSIHEAVFFYRQWMENFSKSVKLEKESIEARYEALKTQVNPHFIFNSLNSLTALVDNNPQAVDYIQNLSLFLRYVLKSRERELVTLAEELEMLDQYIALQKTRFNQNIDFRIDVPQACYNLHTPPLALQMLVENCIKHNVASRQHPLRVHVFADGLTLTVRNNLQPKLAEHSTGQGLRNLTERYRYFTERAILIDRTDSAFSVELPLLMMDEKLS